MLLDLIWLNKGNDRSDHFPDNWIYYRVNSVDASGQTAGSEGSNIEVCKLDWPTLADAIGFEAGQGIVETVGNVGLNSAHQDTSQIVRSKFSVDHNESVLIGVRERQA